MAFVKYKIADNAYAQLATALPTTATTITIKNAQNLPAGGNWIGTLAQYGEDGFVKKFEKVLVQSNVAGTLTVERGFGGNAVLEFNESDYIFLNVVAEIIEDIQEELTRVGQALNNLAEKNAIFGPDGKFLPEKMPDIAINNTFTASSQTAMLGLKAEVGDMCIRTDQNSMMYVLVGTDSKVLANWKKISVDLSPYYNKTEVNALLDGKAANNHNHDNAYVKITGNSIITAPTQNWATGLKIKGGTANEGVNAIIIENDVEGESWNIGHNGSQNGTGRHRLSFYDNKTGTTNLWISSSNVTGRVGDMGYGDQNWTNEWTSWTPTMYPYGSNANIIHINHAKYKIIGKTCFFSARIDVNVSNYGAFFAINFPIQAKSWCCITARSFNPTINTRIVGFSATEGALGFDVIEPSTLPTGNQTFMFSGNFEIA